MRGFCRLRVGPATAGLPHLERCHDALDLTIDIENRRDPPEARSRDALHCCT